MAVSAATINTGGAPGGGGIPRSWLLIGGGGIALALIVVMMRGRSSSSDDPGADGDPGTLPINAALALGQVAYDQTRLAGEESIRDADLAASIGALSGQLGQVGGQLSGQLDANQQALLGQFGGVTAQIANAQAGIDKVSGQVANVQTGVSGVNANVSAQAQSTRDSVYLWLSQFFGQQTGLLNAYQAQTQAGLGAISGQVGALGGQVGALGSQVSVLGGQVAGIGGKVDNLDTRMGIFGSQLGTIGGQVGNLGGDLDWLTSWLVGRTLPAGYTARPIAGAPGVIVQAA